MNRRQFIRTTAFGAAALGAAPLLAAEKPKAKQLFKISLAEWSFHNAIFAKKMDHLDFPLVSKRDYGIDMIELVNQFFPDKAKDKKYLIEFKKRCKDNGVKVNLIMIDDEGDIGDVDAKKRTQGVENHYKWVEAAKFLGCKMIRVNAETGGVGSFEEQQKRAADGLGRLCEFAAKIQMNVIVENHGGLASNGQWLAGLMKAVNLPNCGTLPDFGNWTEYDRYKGVTEMMPFAKAVSAKSNDFDAAGNESHTDYRKMLKIVLDGGYHSYLGIEYEGEKTPEPEGVRLTKVLLDKIHAELIA